MSTRKNLQFTSVFAGQWKTNACPIVGSRHENWGNSTLLQIQELSSGIR